MRRGVIAVFVALAVTLAGCGQDNSKSAETGPVDTAAPGGPGPFAVGRQSVTITDAKRSNRSLVVDVVYPANPDAAQSAPASKYVFIPGIEYPSPLAKDAPPVAAGSFPVVVYSHGSGGLRFVSSFLTEALASHGFIVLAADHTGNTAADLLLGSGVSEQENETNRPADVKFMLDEFLGGKQVPGVSRAIDRQRVGVIGHSFGGFTALTTVAGWKDVKADPRVKAVVGMAPYTRNVPSPVLQKVDVPTMLITGTKDVITPIDTDTARPWDIIPGRPLYRVDLVGAAHQSFSDACAYQKLLRTLPNVPPQFISFVDAQAAQGCGPDVLDIGRAQQLINTYVIAFLRSYVAGDTSYEQYLVSQPPTAEVQVKR